MAYSYDDRDREFRQSPPPRPPRKEDNDLGSWILIIFLFIVAWPAGLAVLLSKVLGNDSRRKNAARSTRLLMKHGNTTYLEVLTAQQTLLNAQLSQVANRFTEIQGVITLYQALGGGRM